MSVKLELKCFSLECLETERSLKKNIVNGALECWVASLCSSSTLMRWALWFTQSWEDEWCFCGMSRLQSQHSVIAVNRLTVVYC